MNKDDKLEQEKDFYMSHLNFVRQIQEEMTNEKKKKYPKFNHKRRCDWIAKNTKLLDIVEKCNRQEDLKNYIKEYTHVKNEYLVQQYLWLIILIIIFVAIVIGLSLWLLKV
ncbi:hypothetical protein [Mycoplasma crocodyli]|uniref:Uncharacterized protein n=1 Tax=Mycoplasma crocodyli (strain ATCC 51981 / MP145) TaxID=512564 RepID=D5E630_MYCCM|nr:hypothetical protein [Mycoplasma crocodyli]ADE19795.1 hypothetical protein MCRO_0612 [Mycoplasma crocodyli MP145]